MTAEIVLCDETTNRKKSMPNQKRLISREIALFPLQFLAGMNPIRRAMDQKMEQGIGMANAD